MYGYRDLDPKAKKESKSKIVKKAKKSNNDSSLNNSLQKSGMSTNENTMNSFDSKNQFHIIDRSTDFVDYKDQQRRAN